VVGGGERFACGVGEVVTLFVGWEGAVFYVFAIVLDGGADEAPEWGIGVAADEFGAGGRR